MHLLTCFVVCQGTSVLEMPVLTPILEIWFLSLHSQYMGNSKAVSLIQMAVVVKGGEGFRPINASKNEQSQDHYSHHRKLYTFKFEF